MQHDVACLVYLYDDTAPSLRLIDHAKGLESVSHLTDPVGRMPYERGRITTRTVVPHLEAPTRMQWTDVDGYAASLTVLATFCMTSMWPLRAFALASNVLFILYGFAAHIYPVLILHVI